VSVKTNVRALGSTRKSVYEQNGKHINIVKTTIHASLCSKSTNLSRNTHISRFVRRIIKTMINFLFFKSPTKVARVGSLHNMSVTMLQYYVCTHDDRVVNKQQTRNLARAYLRQTNTTTRNCVTNVCRRARGQPTTGRAMCTYPHTVA